MCKERGRFCILNFPGMQQIKLWIETYSFHGRVQTKPKQIRTKCPTTKEKRCNFSDLLGIGETFSGYNFTRLTNFTRLDVVAITLLKN